jgi:hypothetical protein
MCLSLGALAIEPRTPTNPDHQRKRYSLVEPNGGRVVVQLRIFLVEAALSKVRNLNPGIPNGALTADQDTKVVPGRPDRAEERVIVESECSAAAKTRGSEPSKSNLAAWARFDKRGKQ